MIRKYKQFLLNESKLLLEAALSVDNSLMSKLKTISKGLGYKSNDLVTKILDYIEDEEWVSEIDLKQDFFKAEKDDDKVSFLQKNRVKPGIDPYTATGRTEINIGRAMKYICKLYDITVTDKQIEELVNDYKSVSSEEEPEFLFYEGKKILEGYDTDYYYNTGGTLGSSCMNDEFDYLKIYTKNKEKVRLLVLINGGQVTGRALVWKLDKSPCEAKYFMDRVYTNNEYDVNKFIAYAENNNFMYKQRMGCGDEEAVKFRYKGKDLFGEIRVELYGNCSGYPYLDTLSYLNKDKTELSNIPSWKCYLLWDTDGECERCDECNGKSKNKDLCYGCSEGAMFLKSKDINIDIERGRKNKRD